MSPAKMKRKSSSGHFSCTILKPVVTYMVIFNVEQSVLFDYNRLLIKVVASKHCFIYSASTKTISFSSNRSENNLFQWFGKMAYTT